MYYYKRNRLEPEDELKYQAMYLPLDELLATCDIISLHLPVTGETERMCDREFFEKMKPGAYFVNTSRGELVDDDALIQALMSGRLSMAGLDTLDREPVQKDHPLLSQPAIADRLLFTPHIGGITASSFRRGYAMIWENLERLSDGKPLLGWLTGRSPCFDRVSPLPLHDTIGDERGQGGGPLFVHPSGVVTLPDIFC